jgi:hypothetical protein
MGETILFSIPSQVDMQPVFMVLWYQSVDGKIWDAVPVDTTLLSALYVDLAGKYTWASILADPTKYHKIVTESADGTINPFGFILTPRQPAITKTSFYGQKLDEGSIINTVAVYDIGDTIDLALRVDSTDILALGLTIPVEIKDIFGNLIATLEADLVNDIYITEWKVPFSLHKLYNVVGVTDASPDLSLYTLTDNWVFPDGLMQFGFSVNRKLEDVVKLNCRYEITLDGVEATNGSVSPSTTFSFTSELSPFYCGLADVIDIHPEYLSTIDPFVIADNIVDFSTNVDRHLRPNKLASPERYWNAVKNWVAYTTAYMFLSSGPLDVSAESKDLEGFKIYKQYDRDLNSGIHRYINENLKFYELIILAGGLDTPYVSKTFVKGIYDPNRPQTSRSNLDVSDYYPWVNESSYNRVMTDEEGRQIEIKGTRTIAYRWRLGYYSSNFGSSGADLNSHATFPSIGAWTEQQETMY